MAVAENSSTYSPTKRTIICVEASLYITFSTRKLKPYERQKPLNNAHVMPIMLVWIKLLHGKSSKKEYRTLSRTIAALLQQTCLESVTKTPSQRPWAAFQGSLG